MSNKKLHGIRLQVSLALKIKSMAGYRVRDGRTDRQLVEKRAPRVTLLVQSTTKGALVAHRTLKVDYLCEFRGKKFWKDISIELNPFFYLAVDFEFITENVITLLLSPSTVHPVYC